MNQVQGDKSFFPGETCSMGAAKNTSRDYVEIGVILLVILALYELLSHFSFLPRLTIHAGMGYGIVFFIGLVAASSTCMATAGGLIVALAAKFHEMHPEARGWQKLRPHLFFNLGRLISYTVLGGAIGWFGSAISITSSVTGIITVVASLVMLVIGLKLLNLFPILERFSLRLPRGIGQKIFSWNQHGGSRAPFFLGASTFFLPCGFTQALQLYVLSQGSAFTGALTMGIFALGTLPSLLSLGVVWSVAKGKFQRYLFKFSGVMAILLGVLSLQGGLTTLGVSFENLGFSRVASLDPNVAIEKGVQVARMKVSGLDYTPHRFTVVQDVPVRWEIDGSGAEGCAQVLKVPKLGITKYLSPEGTTVVEFTPHELGPITFSCIMGMTTRGSAFEVVAPREAMGKSPEPPVLSNCDPKITDCKG